MKSCILGREPSMAVFRNMIFSKILSSRLIRMQTQHRGRKLWCPADEFVRSHVVCVCLRRKKSTAAVEDDDAAADDVGDNDNDDE
jgi:hypothetical protein